ncbi:Cdc6/Cdc18 family protein [Halocatena halophila]|uniref:Cdc6/Cdc18 family protein n=1 Tax=Halocatena halophila TaxID=2814576 RepID=UPI002ED0E45E
MPRFTPETSIFDNHDVLDEEWTPETIQGRDEEIEQYQEYLQPVINGWKPKNIFLYGKTGVGKTVVTERLLKDLQDSADQFDVPLSVIKITCDNQSSSYQAAVKLLNELLRQRDQPTVPATGYSQQDIFDKLWSEIDKIGGTILFVMDEIDNISSPDDILYQIPRAQKNNYVEDARLGIIAISNDYSFTEDLSPKAKSTLRETELHFSAYDANELIAILEHRADLAFHEGVINEGVIERIAAIVAQEAGDARLAMDLLLEAGEIAVRRDSSTVSLDDVERAEEFLESNWVSSAVKAISSQEQVSLASVVFAECNGDTPSRTKDLYRQYCAICESISREPTTSRQMREHLNELAFQNLLHKHDKNEGIDGGRYYTFELEPDMKTFLQAVYRIESRVFDDVFVEKLISKTLQNSIVSESELDFVD